MEGKETDLPVSQKTFSNDFESFEVGDVSGNGDGNFNYLSQVCELSDFSLNLTPVCDADSGFVSQSANIPLVLYDDEDEPKTDDETPNFFFGLLNDSLMESLPATSQATLVTQSQSDSK